jgi:hypothetical protein
LTLNKPATAASLSIGAGALALSTNTKRALATIRMHDKRHRSLTFKVSVIATDSQGQTTKAIVAFNLRRQTVCQLSSSPLLCLSLAVAPRCGTRRQITV